MKFATVEMLLLNAVVLLSPCVAEEVEPSKQPPHSNLANEKFYPMAYPLDDLPVWQIDKQGNRQLDASIVISHIRTKVAPASWERHASAGLSEGTISGSPVLFVTQTSETHDLVGILLDRARAFARKDVNQELNDNLRDANVMNQNVLLFVGDPDAQVTSEYFDLQRDSGTQTEFRNFITQYVHISNLNFLAAKGVETSGKPMLVVFSVKGELIGHGKIETLTRNGSIDAELLSEFLQSHQPRFPNAKQVIQSAIAQAKREKKKVLVHVSGPGCSPCIQLAHYLTAHKSTLSKDYVLAKLDTRMPHSDEVTQGLGKCDKSIPWLVILSESGEQLVSGDTSHGNIAFPRTEEQMSHFKFMLESTCVRITTTEISQLLEELPNFVGKPGP